MLGRRALQAEGQPVLGCRAWSVPAVLKKEQEVRVAEVDPREQEAEGEEMRPKMQEVMGQGMDDVRACSS